MIDKVVTTARPNSTSAALLRADVVMAETVLPDLNSKTGFVRVSV
jgi:hypothetical protein